MALARRHLDTMTGDMFAVPAPVAALPGAMDYSLAVRRLLSDAIKACPLNAAEIAFRMSELTGQTITENSVHAWTAPSREGWRFPLEYLPAFEVATETKTLTAWQAGLHGGHLIVGPDVLHAQLGRLERTRDEAAQRIKQLKKQMGKRK